MLALLAPVLLPLASSECAPPPLAPTGPVSSTGPYETAEGHFDIRRGWHSATTTKIFYPIAPDGTCPSFPVVGFGHGMGGGGEIEFGLSYKGLLTTVASYGFVVLAPLACTWDCVSELSLDIARVIAACDADRSLHAGLAHASFTRVGVGGHSMGGTAAGRTAAFNATELNVHAYFALSSSYTGDDEASRLTMPLFYTTGEDDDIAIPFVVRKSFNSAENALTRVYAKLKDGGHLECCSATGKKRLNPFVPQFLLCHLLDDDQGCSNMYSTTSAYALTNALATDLVDPGDRKSVV